MLVFSGVCKSIYINLLIDLIGFFCPVFERCYLAISCHILPPTADMNTSSSFPSKHMPIRCSKLTGTRSWWNPWEASRRRKLLLETSCCRMVIGEWSRWSCGLKSCPIADHFVSRKFHETSAACCPCTQQLCKCMPKCIPAPNIPKIDFPCWAY